MKRHYNYKDKQEEKKKFHHRLVQRILDDPGMIMIDGNPVDPRTIKAKASEVFIGNSYTGDYKVDIAILRELEPQACELDVIEALSTQYGFGMMSACKSLRGKLALFYRKCPREAVRQFREKIGFNDDYYTSVSLDILLAYPDYTGLIKFERLPGYNKAMLVKDGGSWNYVENE